MELMRDGQVSHAGIFGAKITFTQPVDVRKSHSKMLIYVLTFFSSIRIITNSKPCFSSPLDYHSCNSSKFRHSGLLAQTRWIRSSLGSYVSIALACRTQTRHDQPDDSLQHFRRGCFRRVYRCHDYAVQLHVAAEVRQPQSQRAEVPCREGYSLRQEADTQGD